MKFPVYVKIPVSWGDMDAFGHVNNTLYFKYFESARIRYLEQVGIMELMSTRQIGPILAATSCQFKIPITYPNTVRSYAGVDSIGRTSFVLKYKIELLDGELVAEGDSIIVMHNYATGENISVPVEVVAKIEALEEKKLK